MLFRSQTEVGASITSGDFLLTAHGAFESAIGLGSAPRSINAQTVSAVQDFSATSLNYFRLVDYVADGGANVSVGLNSDFIYTGTASASFDISGTYLDIIPFFDAGSPVAPTCADDWSTSCQLMTAYFCCFIWYRCCASCYRYYSGLYYDRYTISVCFEIWYGKTKTNNSCRCSEWII